MKTSTTIDTDARRMARFLATLADSESLADSLAEAEAEADPIDLESDSLFESVLASR